MSKQKLQRHLAELRREIDGASLGADTHERLERLADEIEQALEDEEPDYESVRERVEDAMLTFEAEHPRFSRLLSEVTDTLAKLGV